MVLSLFQKSCIVLFAMLFAVAVARPQFGGFGSTDVDTFQSLPGGGFENDNRFTERLPNGGSITENQFEEKLPFGQGFVEQDTVQQNNGFGFGK